MILPHLRLQRLDPRKRRARARRGAVLRFVGHGMVSVPARRRGLSVPAHPSGPFLRRPRRARSLCQRERGAHVAESNRAPVRPSLHACGPPLSPSWCTTRHDGPESNRHPPGCEVRPRISWRMSDAREATSHHTGDSCCRRAVPVGESGSRTFTRSRDAALGDVRPACPPA